MENSSDIPLALDRSTSSTKTYLLFSLCILGALLRFSYLYWGPSIDQNIWSDMQGYNRISEDILKGIWNENHFFQSIGYPLFMTLIKKFSTTWSATLGFIQGTLSFFTLILLFKTVKQGLGERAAFLSLAIASLHPPFIIFNVVALPEPLFIFFMSVCAYSMSRLMYEKGSRLFPLTLWAMSFMAGFWLKGTHVFWAPLFLGLFFFYQKFSLKAVLPAVIIMLTSLSLHGALTKSKIHKIQLSASTGGLNFIEGKCPSKKNRDSIGYAWQSPLYYQLGMHQQKTWPRPFTDSSYFMKEGFKCIQKNPSVLIQSLEGITFLFIGNTIWPFNQFPYAGPLRLYEQLFAIFSITGLIFFGLYLRRKRDLKLVFVWVLPVLALFICVYIFKSEMRYRIPFDIWIIPMSAKGWLDLITHKRGEHVSFSRGPLSE